MFENMLSRDVVILQLTQLAVRLGRKIEAKTFDAYHSFFVGRLDDEQFIYACKIVTEEDDRFPAPSRILSAGKGHRRREHGAPYILNCGPLSECLSDVDRGHAYGGDDQFRGRPHTSPAVERLVYEDAAITAETIPDEPVTSRLRRIVSVAESALERMEARATMPAPPPPPAQAELAGLETGNEATP